MDPEARKKLSGEIVKTIAFFDMFDFPLTRMEVWRHLGVSCGLGEAAEVLSDAGNIETKDGFYFLLGRAEIVATRLRRHNYGERKIRRARLVSSLFRFIPWIRLIAVGNRIGADNLKNASDIDLFIVTERKRVWLTRLGVTVPAKLLGLRPNFVSQKDKICLSFFLSEEALDLRALMLGGDAGMRSGYAAKSVRFDENTVKVSASGELPVAGESAQRLKFPDFLYGSRSWRGQCGQQPCETDDTYFLYWLSGLLPVYDAGGAYDALLKANSWIFEVLPNWQAAVLAPRRRPLAGFRGFYRDFIDMLCGGLELNAKRLQLRRLPEYLARPLNTDTRVMANDRIIKLHANDRRAEYRERFAGKLREIGALR